jgi:hypothetical protein
MKSGTFNYQSGARMELVNYHASFMQEECCLYYGVVAL